MIQLVGRRLLLLIPTLILVSFGVFALVTMIPGDVATYLAGGENATPQKIEQIRTQLGLGDPLLVQYGRWAADAVHLDFGKSLVTGKSVAGEIGQRLPVTLSIVVGALLVGMLLGVPLGLASGARTGGWGDRTFLGLTSAGLAIPNFVIAILLIRVFAIQFGWFDAVGFDTLVSPKGVLQVGPWLKSITLPAIALGIGVAARLGRQIRAGVIDTMHEPYVRTAWAKGCRPGTVVAKHVFKNAAIPTVTVAGLLFGGLLGGSVIVESIVAAPGVGDYLVRALTAKDLPVVQGMAVIFVLAFAIINLTVDLIYGWLNPKVKVA